MSLKDSAASFNAQDAAEAFGQGVGRMVNAFTGLSVPVQALSALQQRYVQEATALWNQALATPSAAPTLGDRRFASPAWSGNPGSRFMAQMYLLNARTLGEMAEQVTGDEKTRQRLKFAVQQWVDAASPSNYLALNPEAQQLALKTQGESLTQGLKMLWQDLQRGHVSQTDETVFEVGRNVATTEGAVVFENELIQLIEYKPITTEGQPQVHEKPMLFIPPCINKFYILDLQPDNSLIRYTVAQGHRVFVVSWRNPDESLAKLGWDDYIERGVITALRTVQAICGVSGRQGSVNTLGFCVGGTLLSTALAVLAARGEQPAASVTLLTTFLDFTHTGILDIFVDEPMVQMRELTLGPKSPSGGALLKGQELASTFSALRPNDLLWNYVVGNYLKGETPPPFDLLYWNGDSTNLPGPMYCWYLRHTYLQNELKKPGALTVCGERIDLRQIQAPVYVYASREDHIVPWESAYASTQILSGPKRFVLGASGHIAGVINPPAKRKRSHWVSSSARFPAQAPEWLEQSQEQAGSWWTDWALWLAGHAGGLKAAPKAYGNRQFKAIEPAPGRYVKQKA
jgi:polyhydroxyalkanoate synthase